MYELIIMLFILLSKSTISYMIGSLTLYDRITDRV